MPPKQKTKLKIVKVPSLIIPFNISYRAALPVLAEDYFTDIERLAKK